ncbi:MAG: EamA family transporter RarD [Nocardioides sp.]|uniref:EamA family transporter RarD n=1 Tax=Nocardioides sp. TaxID=35761 RepID=UPI0039E2AAA8
MSEHRRGILAGLAAYLMWGLFPLYWPLLERAGAFEILAHRLIWSAVLMTALVLATGRRRQFAALLRTPRKVGLLAAATLAVSVNWGLYIWAVNAGYVVETSLGYFINPLISVALGVVVLRERLRRLQWTAIAIGAVAVVVLTLTYGRPPWIALTLACSFGTYGLIKKLAGVPAVEALALETAIATPLALVYVVALVVRGESHFATGHLAVFFVLAGVVTALPLLCFGEAANRIPLSLLGLMQYLAPVLQFALGVLYFHEDMPAGRWAGFVLVWVALMLFTADGLRQRRARPLSGLVTESF